MTKRTDIHRPSAIKTSQYEFVACMTDRADADMSLLDERKTLIGFMQRTGATYATTSTADRAWSAAGFLDYAVFHHAPTNKLVCMGMDCAAKMDMGVDAQFRSFKARVQAGIEAKTGKAKARAALAERGRSDAFDMTGIAGDIISKLVRYGSLSDKQWSFLGSLVERERARPAREAAIAAEKATQREVSQHLGAVGDRTQFVVTIKAQPTYESQFGTVVINICNDANGNVVIYKGKSLGQKNETVSLTATVKEHGERDGIKQTIIARPSNVKVADNSIAA